MFALIPESVNKFDKKYSLCNTILYKTFEFCSLYIS